MVRDGIKYTHEHEWTEIIDGVARIGITDFAQTELGDIVFVDLPQVGDTFEIGDSFAVVESVKAASEIYTQVAGKVIAVNEKLDDDPSLLNSEPFVNEIVTIEVTDIDEGAFISANEYRELIGE